MAAETNLEVDTLTSNNFWMASSIGSRAHRQGAACLPPALQAQDTHTRPRLPTTTAGPPYAPPPPPSFPCPREKFATQLNRRSRPRKGGSK